MTNIQNGSEHENARIAEAILTDAQALIAGSVSLDLLALKGSFSGNSLFIDLPIGDGLVAPLEVGLHSPRRKKALKLEAFYLAETVKSYVIETSAILVKAKRLRRAGEAFARAARSAGAPVAVGRMAIERQTSAWGFALANLRVEILFPGADLKSASWWSGSDIAGLRSFVAMVADVAEPRKRMRDTVSRHHGACLIDPVAYAAMHHFGVTVPALFSSLNKPYYRRKGAVLPHWHDGVVHAEVELTPEICWVQDRLIIQQQLPEIALHAAAGRLLTDFVAHPTLAATTVAQADHIDCGVSLAVKPLVPLLLLPDGAAVPVPPSEAVLPRPRPDANGGPDEPWFRSWLFASSGIDDDYFSL